MRVIVGSDHVGFNLKRAVIEHLASLGTDATDAGPDNSGDPVDYPDFALEVCRRVASGEFERGVLICGTGLGMSIAANRFPGVRATLCHDVFTARMARAHNDANVLCLGAWVVTPQRMEGILEEWLETDFEGERHTPRLAKLDRFWREARSATPVPVAGLRQLKIRFGVAVSPQDTIFAPLLFAGKLAEGLKAAAEYGFQAVEISLRSARDLSAEALGSMLDRHGLSLTAIATGQACLQDSLCLADPNPEVREAAVERLQSLIELAGCFQAYVIVGGIRGWLKGSPQEQQQTRAAVTRALRECADFAAHRGVTLLVEPINRYETNFINTVSEALGWIEEIGHPGVRLLLDTFHMNIEETDLPSVLRTASRSLAALHIADSNRRAPGYGHLDFIPILEALVEIGFEGPITAEILPLPNAEAAIKQTAEFLGLRPVTGRGVIAGNR